MSTEQVLQLVSDVLDVPKDALRRKYNNYATERHIAICIMMEEENKPIDIAYAVGLESRDGYNSARKAINNKLLTDAAFKKGYLACIARIAEMEDLK